MIDPEIEHKQLLIVRNALTLFLEAIINGYDRSYLIALAESYNDQLVKLNLPERFNVTDHLEH